MSVFSQGLEDDLDRVIRERDEARAMVAELVTALNEKNRFVSTWKDCLSGVQMSEEDFNADAKLREHRELIIKAEAHHV